MDKKDWRFVIIILIILLPFSYFALNTLKGKEISVLNYVSIIGSVATIFGLIFTIYQQFKIQSTSNQIERHLTNYQKQVALNLLNWHIEKTIIHCEKINSYDEVNKIEKGCVFILTEIQENLKDCAKICKENSIKKL